jgi:hypothetical protein
VSNLLDRLEALRNEYRELADEYEKDGDEDARNRSLLVAYKIDAILADERKRREPVEMSCPTCEKVTPCFESREMCCSECLSMFETPEQLDANLDADRKARGMPAVEHKPTTPDPRDALLSQAREALVDASLEHSTWTTGHAERCSACKAIAAIDAYRKETP